ncbi:MAG: DUF5320 domain-containing protein [Bacteroidales bacterium]
MPRGDRTGPMGQGPMTGRNLGFCAGYDTPGMARNFGRGMGFGRGMSRGIGRGMGFGMRRGFGRGAGFAYGWNAPMTKEEEIQSLKTRAEFLDQNRADITRRLEELEKGE